MISETKMPELKINLWILFITLFFSLLKGGIGILGASESLVADALCSFCLSFTVLKLIFLKDIEGESAVAYRTVWFLGLLVSAMLILGILDVLIFSIVRMVKASRGLLVDPSPYAFWVAVLSVGVNLFLYRFTLSAERNVLKRELSLGLFLSVIASSIVAIGIGAAKKISLYADAIAAMIVAAVLVPIVIDLFRRSLKITTDWVLFDKFKVKEG
jgi:divalent metal cation (Fe/Co/Zn/Cd) transporter